MSGWMLRKTVHEVDKQSSLYYLINAFIGAYNRRTDALSEGLHAIALALATPQDNSGDVQAHINQVTARLKQPTDALATAVEAQKGK